MLFLRPRAHVRPSRRSSGSSAPRCAPSDGERSHSATQQDVQTSKEKQAAAAADEPDDSGGLDRTKRTEMALKAARLRRDLEKQIALMKVTQEELKNIESAMDKADSRYLSSKAKPLMSKSALSGEYANTAVDGLALQTMDEDELWPYGHIAESAGDYLRALRGADAASPTTTPPSAIILAKKNFTRELKELVRLINGNQAGNDENTALEQSKKKKRPESRMRETLSQLQLSNDAVWEREEARPQVKAPWIIKGPYYILCYMLDALFDGKPIERFWFLETVARMPYFSYVSCLHLYESLGWWRVGMQMKRIHAAEEFNEAHHLLTMEALGGDESWTTRFLGQHSAIIYYWVLVAMWLISPTLAYNFSELIEMHAVDTYGEFLDANAELLKTLPAPPITQYYYTSETYMFDEFQTRQPAGARRPQVENLYDVFEAIRDDEAEHVATMADCQDKDFLVRSPNYEKAVAAAITTAAAANLYLSRAAEQMEEAGMDEEVAASILDTVTGFLDAIFPFL
ncbi:ubiquinol oxidase [Pycnococcus provasolii]